jgi:hypothetical protein
MDPLTDQLTRAAFVRLRALARNQEFQTHVLNASLELPLLIRRHGLAATLTHWCNGAAAEDDTKASEGVARRQVARAFFDVLNEVAPIRGNSLDERVGALSTEPLRLYLLHSRLALVLADVWVELAEPLLPKARADESARGQAAAQNAGEVSDAA